MVPVVVVAKVLAAEVDAVKVSTLPIRPGKKRGQDVRFYHSNEGALAPFYFWP